MDLLTKSSEGKGKRKGFSPLDSPRAIARTAWKTALVFEQLLAALERVGCR
jgi:hypothetical protein